MANDKPTVDFNLDTYKTAADLTPYRVVLAGKPFELAHLDTLDGFDISDVFSGEAGADGDLLQIALGDKWDDFVKAGRGKLPHGAMKELIRRYLAHCGVEVKN